MVALNLHNTLGALQIGTIFSVYLFGVVTLQLFHYFQTFGDDRRVFKLFAASVWVLELLHTMCACAETYRGTILYYGNPLGYQRYPFMGAATLIGGLITMLVQLFFCLRVWKALPSPAKYASLICAVAAVLRGVGGIYLGVRVVLSKTLQEYREVNRWIIETLLAVGAAIDVIIAAAMVYFLIMKRETALSRVSLLIDRLVTYTIRTGVLTSIGAIAVLISFEILPETFIWVALYVCLAKLYSNSLLSALNERRRLRNVIADSSANLESKVLRNNPSHRPIFSYPSIAIEMNTTVTGDDKMPGFNSISPHDSDKIVSGRAL